MHFQVLLYNDVTWIKLVELFYQIYITIIAKNIIINFLYILPHIYHMLVLHTYTQTHTRSYNKGAPQESYFKTQYDAC